MERKFLYRAYTDNKGFWSGNGWGDDDYQKFTLTGVTIHFTKYDVIRETEKSYLINDFGLRWVKKNGTNIYARDTKMKAIEDLRCRRERMKKIITARLKTAEYTLELIDNLYKDKENGTTIDQYQRSLIFD